MLCGPSHRRRRPGHPLPLVRLDVGLNAPLALVVGFGVGLFGSIIEPDRSRAPGDLWRSLRLPDVVRRRRLASCLASIAVSAPLWATAVAHFAKKSMATEGSNVASGLAMAIAAFVMALVTLSLALAVGDIVARALGRAGLDVDPRHGLLAGAALGAAIVAIGVSTGTTSGEGGWLGIWGVLKRPELDLRAPFLLGAVASAGYLLPSLDSAHADAGAGARALAARIHDRGARWGSAVAGSGLGAREGRAARQARRSPRCAARPIAITTATARSSAAGTATITMLASIPAPIDIPGNGIDEDCSGG